MKTIIEIFNKIRGLKYSIPESIGDKAYNCSSKCGLLKEKLSSIGLKSNYVVCSFDWKKLDLPEYIFENYNGNEGLHVYLEVDLYGKMIDLDPSWDLGLKNIFEISNFDGENSTNIAVNTKKKFSYEESNKIMNGTSESEIKKHLEENKLFYRDLNIYFDNIRKGNL